MHIEKKFFENIFNTMINVSGKTKDNEKARIDIIVHYRRPDLELKPQANGANYSLTSKGAKQVCC